MENIELFIVSESHRRSEILNSPSFDRGAAGSDPACDALEPHSGGPVLPSFGRCFLCRVLSSGPASFSRLCLLRWAEYVYRRASKTRKEPNVNTVNV